jgi:hypothetical protein
LEIFLFKDAKKGGKVRIICHGGGHSPGDVYCDITEIENCEKVEISELL